MTRKQKVILPFLVSGLSIHEIARRSSVSDTTIYRWMEDPDFQDALDEALDQQLRDAFQKSAGVELSGILPDAIAAVRDVLKDPKSKPRAKLAAAKLAWDIALKIQAIKSRMKQAI